MSLVKTPHSAIICGATACGKTEFLLNLLESERGPNVYAGILNKMAYSPRYRWIFIFCPTLEINRTYHAHKWLFTDDRVMLINPKTEGGLNLALKRYYYLNARQEDGESLFIIDDCSALKDLKTKNQMLSEIAFSGRHAGCSMWILTQKYNSILTDFREQIKWLCLFYCKDRDSFADALRENDVIPSKDERDRMRDLLAQHKHSKLILVTEQPTSYNFFK